MRARMFLITGVFLPCNPLSSSNCSVRSRRRMCTTRPVSARNAEMPRDTAEPRIFCRRPIMPWLSASSRVARQLRFNRAASLVTLATRPFCADTATTCCAETPKISAELCFCRSICDCTSCGLSIASHKVSILLRTTTRVAGSWLSSTRCSRQIDKSDCVTPVSAPRMNTTACA